MSWNAVRWSSTQTIMTQETITVDWKAVQCAHTWNRLVESHTQTHTIAIRNEYQTVIDYQCIRYGAEFNLLSNVCCNRRTQTLILECWLLIWGATTTHKSQIDFKCRNLKLINMEREMEQENLSLSLFRFSVVNNCVWSRIENRRYNKSLRISNIFLYCCVQDCINNINRDLTWTHILQSFFYRNRTNLRNSNKIFVTNQKSSSCYWSA